MDVDLNDFGQQVKPIDGVNLGFTRELIDKIRDKKDTNPAMFVSAWQDDVEGIAEKKPEDSIEKWLTASEEGDLKLVQSLFEETPTLLNAQDADGYTALHRAAYNNNKQVVEYLLSSGAKVDSRTNEGWTPLHSASNWANFEIVGILLSHEANVNALSKGNLTALHLAVSSRGEDPDDVYFTVRYLLQAPGIDAGVVAGNGDTVLMIARRSSERLFNAIRDFLDRP
ncbi:unnamed protein product [Caenorhabditis sp. 36 PRJEB53466]|nr:unnamed protein product [Caenorhabditis sp. 36 PRJEB53466]